MINHDNGVGEGGVTRTGAGKFIWGFDYHFTNYTFKQELELQKEHISSPLWQDMV